jgi:hypothetical protein
MNAIREGHIRWVDALARSLHRAPLAARPLAGFEVTTEVEVQHYDRGLVTVGNGREALT